MASLATSSKDLSSLVSPNREFAGAVKIHYVKRVSPWKIEDWKSSSAITKIKTTIPFTRLSKRYSPLGLGHDSSWRRTSMNSTDFLSNSRKLYSSDLLKKRKENVMKRTPCPSSFYYALFPILGFFSWVLFYFSCLRDFQVLAAQTATDGQDIHWFVVFRRQVLSSD